MRISKLLLFLILSIIFIFGSFSICSADEQEEIPEIVIHTGTPTGGWYQMGAQISEWTNKQVKGFPITASPGGGAVGNVLIIAKEELNADVGISYGIMLKAYEENRRPFKDKTPNKDLRAIFSLIPNVYHFLVQEDIDATFVDDIIKNKMTIKTTVGNPGDSAVFLSEIIFEFFGSKFPEDIKNWGGSVQGSITTGERSNLYKNRLVNSNISTLNIPSADITSCMSARPTKLLSLSEELQDYLVEEWGYVPFDLPPGMYPGQDCAVHTVALPLVYFTKKNVNKEAIYLLTKTVAEKEKELQESISGFKNWKAKDMIEGLGIPIHEGALKYYRERGWIK